MQVVTTSSNSSPVVPSVISFFFEKNILAYLCRLLLLHSTNGAYGCFLSVYIKKAIINCVSIILQNLSSNPPLFYHILSHNYINNILLYFPVLTYSRWGMEELMPDWCSIVKVLAVRLKHNPSLFQFFIFDTDDDDEDDDDYDYDNKATEGNDADKSGVTGGGITSSKVSFPLYTTSVKLACSKYAETDYMCWTECMCSVVNVIGMKIDAVRRIVTKGVREQRMILKMLRDRLSRSIESVESALQSQAAYSDKSEPFLPTQQSSSFPHSHAHHHLHAYPASWHHSSKPAMTMNQEFD